MMAKIILELTTVEKASEITSEQVLAWARKVEVLGGHKVLMEATKYN